MGIAIPSGRPSARLLWYSTVVGRRDAMDRAGLHSGVSYMTGVPYGTHQSTFSIIFASKPATQPSPFRLRWSLSRPLDSFTYTGQKIDHRQSQRNPCTNMCAYTLHPLPPPLPRTPTRLRAYKLPPAGSGTAVKCGGAYITVLALISASWVIVLAFKHQLLNCQGL